jgi:hypothetical protein
MFQYVLVVVLSVNGSVSPQPIATFKSNSHCEAVAAFINRGFVEQGGTNKADCVNALKHSEV